ncbi:Abi family protein [Achromobacter spanius]|uniref:Abortive phage infection protein n=1 Tax=Achromobacter spanius TaxID=217203 RepID=A0A2S0IEK8_9BURK|nr:Abi family protein [Achromobacter spanius]AVJ30197.1 abortive phage infection protein [Achromobacter spanius]
MDIGDAGRTQRKLSQVGYYRLSGYWYPCRKPCLDQRGKQVTGHAGRPLRADRFAPGTAFHDVFNLYLFDKRLRLLALDAIERIEVHLRSVIAHEVGFHDPMAYEQDRFIMPRACVDYAHKGKVRNQWREWSERQRTQLNRSREDCIVWHRANSRAIPFWVAVEAWDFGLLSRYFEMLRGKHRQRISNRLGIANSLVLKDWLQQINTLRNRCAHHARVWNQSSSNTLAHLPHPYFNTLTLSDHARGRLFGLIAVIWFLIKQIGPNSQWLDQIAALIDAWPQLPGCDRYAMGFDHGMKTLPREAFAQAGLLLAPQTA